MKFYVEFFFPTLPGGVATQATRVEASGPGMAVHRAFQEVRKRPGIKGRKHLNQMRVVVEPMGETRDMEAV